MLSMHIGNAIKPMISKNIEYLRRKSPIGCRDTTSLEFLRQQGVESFFSGCLTLLMQNTTKDAKRNEIIYLTDVNDEVRKLLPLEIQQKGILLAHNMNGAARLNKFSRFKAAYDLIEKYSKAKLVVTQRIHSALPCVAMGTPVIFINSPNMPGGGGTKSESSPRTQGFHELFYIVDLYKMSIDEAKVWLHNFDWHDPHPTPSSSLLKRLRATSWNIIRQKNALHEAALKFGVIPFPHFIPPDGNKQDLFHLIFTTKGTRVINLFHGKESVLSSLNWRHWRCIESIFYHHPFAKVIVHSNTLPHRTFGVLKESGYDIEVRRYNLTKMVNGTPAQSFMTGKYNEVKDGKYWYSHETDLLRMLILYKMGGVYMDIDVILVRSIRELPVNVVGYQSNGKIMNGAFMYFEKYHPFLNKSLEHFAKNYNQYSWAANGPLLITSILHSNNSAQYNVSVLDQLAFYMFPYYRVVDECFQQTSGKTFKKNMKIFKEKTFAVHLYSKYSAAQGLNQKLKEGTICKNLLNSFCVLCDKWY
ncbi:lactosylceramide 4-alpha-galactosyltransferase-like [Actinia tenebrosa]|uniref:Lactosylceramide 4-alpha-galactosyltransferase-like n=1 Tax=Actinia tenebrosa TaxID=6105 RepID=A0A6P8I1W3_ACTTE|nr:lactosylceramide 4-alpha-galactosyltransferase-like [Actinia tenebrosa]